MLAGAGRRKSARGRRNARVKADLRHVGVSTEIRLLPHRCNFSRISFWLWIVIAGVGIVELWWPWVDTFDEAVCPETQFTLLADRTAGKVTRL